MNYHPIEIMVAVSLLYFFTFILVKKEKLTMVNHQKIWNTLLLVSFLVTAILGILATLKLKIGWPLWNIKGLHVDPGMVLVTISIYHAIWHMSYFKKIFKLEEPQAELI